MTSIGAGRIKIPASRFFISIALRMCCYRSFRESKSRALCASLLPTQLKDPVIPDLAFSLPDSELPDPSRESDAGRRSADSCLKPNCLCQTRQLADSKQGHL